MAKLSKKFKEEWQFFLNKYNRLICNENCKQCENDCKQSFMIALVKCSTLRKRS